MAEENTGGQEAAQKTAQDASQSATSSGPQGTNQAAEKTAGEQQSDQSVNQQTIDAVAGNARGIQEQLRSTPADFLNTPEGQAMQRQVDGLAKVYDRFAGDAGRVRQLERDLQDREQTGAYQQQAADTGLRQEVSDMKFQLERTNVFNEARALQLQVPELQTKADIQAIATAGKIHPEYQKFQTMVDIDNRRAEEGLKNLSLPDYFALQRHRTVEVGGGVDARMKGRQDMVTALNNQSEAPATLGSTASNVQPGERIIDRLKTQADFDNLSPADRLTAGKEYEAHILEQDRLGNTRLAL